MEDMSAFFSLRNSEVDLAFSKYHQGLEGQRMLVNTSAVEAISNVGMPNLCVPKEVGMVLG
jgi:hypothetical protein